MKFVKMHGAGNDYIYVDCFAQTVKDPAALAIKVSDRHFGIGGDGLILIAPSSVADARMIMYNADGSEAEMCGNGVRCVAKYVYDNIVPKEMLRIETKTGVKDIVMQARDKKAFAARVNMGKPVLAAQEIPAIHPKQMVIEQPLSVGGMALTMTLVSMGNPHCVIYVDTVDSFEVCNIGSQIENHPMFPRRTNVGFVEILSRTEVRQRTWERGSGETLACGTGACAVCVAGVLTGKTDTVIINRLRGGTLTLEWMNKDEPVFMTGPCVEVFRGEIGE